MLPDARLVSLAARGDQGALTAICRRYQQDLYRYCEAILVNSEEAKDALQNTLMSAVRALPGEQRKIELKPWLYRIAHNEAINVLRQRRPQVELDQELALGRGDVGHQLQTREDLRELVADLQSLAERQRGAIVMRELSGLSFEQIAASFGTSPGAARQTVYEARLALQEIREGREMDCDVAREAISANDRRLLRARRLRSHLRACGDCRDFRAAIFERRRNLAALAPPLPALAAAGVLQSVLGAGGSSAGAVGSSASAVAAATAGVAGKTAGASLALKSVAALAAAATLGGGAAAVGVIDDPFRGGGKDEPAREGSAAGAGTASGETGSAGSDSDAANGAVAGAGSARSSGERGTGQQRGNQRGNAGQGAPAHGAPGQSSPPPSDGVSNGNGPPSSTPASPNASSSAPSHTPGPPSSAGNSGNAPGPPASPPGQSSAPPNSGNAATPTTPGTSSSTPATGAPPPGQSETSPDGSGAAPSSGKKSAK